MGKKMALVLVAFAMIISFSQAVFAAEETQQDIVDTALAAGQFNTLAAALEKADLVEALKADGPFTVFAPTDEAFDKLLQELGITADELLAREDLSTILLYHVVPGKVFSGDLKDGMKVKTLADKEVTISLNPTRVNNSNVVTPDIQASNGVIHVIDAVLVP
ncbi:fasciclin domain-containing protein [Alkalihalophilus lindianensis]|uniref:Fasciclin domain-containing protein n=1 Tax=Alkalihalophilus lindianensis TaxID=1630542 RepID=A0ABU3X4J1_9BACI|nr:fasciclin domain-containing protein [Alkalihalophilus lindianensis]MDV2682815.1 fasciclin domain-containing protein [Alkalihalophilus lindianensis]